MANPIVKIKRNFEENVYATDPHASSGQWKVLGELQEGELAYNDFDNGLYIGGPNGEKRLLSVANENKTISQTFYEDVVGNVSGSSARTAQIYSTKKNPTSATTYYLPFHLSNSSGYKELLNNDGMRVSLLEGTSSANGYNVFILGNSTSTGTAGNKYGKIRLYSAKSAYHDISPSDITTNVTHTLPTTGGTILNSGTTAFTQILTSGTKVGTIKINGTSTDIFAPSSTTYTVFGPSGADAKSGLVPAPSTTAGTTKYLREDGQWVIPPDTNTKVNVTLATTTKAYLLGTSTTPTSTAQAVTAIADTGVYLDTVAGKLSAEGGIDSKEITSDETFTINSASTIYTDRGESTSFLFKKGGSEHARFDPNGHFRPGTTDVYTLGTSSLKWKNVYATTFTGALSGNASSSSKVYSTVTNHASGLTYGVPFHVGYSTSENKSLLQNDGFKYWTREGTSSLEGVGELVLGNATSVGTAGNKSGWICLYGQKNYYAEIMPNSDMTSHISLYLPAGGGRLARVTDNVASASNLSGVNTTLSTGVESSAITVKTNNNGTLGSNNLALRNAIDFQWYNTHWQIGNLRGGSTDSAGFGFAYSADGSTYSLKAYVSPTGKLTLADGASLAGNVSVSKSDTTYLSSRVSNSNGSVGIYTATNRGLYDFTSERWMIYTSSGANGTVTVNGNCTGNAGTASKWTTARTITHSGDFTGSYSLDGSGNVTDSAYINHCNCSRANSNTTYCYHRFMTVSSTSSWYDASAILILDEGYQGGGYGIAKVAFRTNDIANASAAVEITWLVRRGFTENCLKYGLYVAKNTAYADVYLHTTGAYSGCTIRVLQNMRASVASNRWTLISSSAAGSGSSGTNTTNSEVYTGISYRTYTTTGSSSDAGVIESATKLATARTINGTSFDGSANITTANWGTARTISISSTAGTTGTSINGSANASLIIPKNMTGFNRIEISSSDNTVSPVKQNLVLNGVNGNTTTALAPGIGFHIGNIGWGSLKFDNGTFKFFNSDCSGYMPVALGTLTATGNITCGNYFSVNPSTNNGGFNYKGRADVGCLCLTNTNWTGYGTSDPESAGYDKVTGRVYFKLI